MALAGGGVAVSLAGSVQPGWQNTGAAALSAELTVQPRHLKANISQWPPHVLVRFGLLRMMQAMEYEDHFCDIVIG